MAVDRRRLLLGASVAALTPSLLPISRLTAQNRPIKIGILTDLSGPFTSVSGPGSIACARLATLEFANRGAIELISADHQNKLEVAVNIARRWIDQENVGAILCPTFSAIGVALNELVREKNSVFLASSPATSTRTGQAGSANTIHWTYSDAMLAASAASLVKDNFDKWYFITTEARSTSDLEKYTTTFIKRSGGSVIGAVRVPLNASFDISTPLAGLKNDTKVLALATIGDATLAAIGQVSEIKKSDAKVVALQLLISDVHALGLKACQATLLTETFYWDLNDRTRQLTSRIEGMASYPSQSFGKPNMIQAGCYSAVLHYLKAVFDINSSTLVGRSIVERMKRMPTDDDAFGKGKIRDDGQKIHPAYLFEVKSPSQSKGAWDYYQLVRTVSAADAFGFNPITGCPHCDSGCGCNDCTCSTSCCPK